MDGHDNESEELLASRSLPTPAHDLFLSSTTIPIASPPSFHFCLSHIAAEPQASAAAGKRLPPELSQLPPLAPASSSSGSCEIWALKQRDYCVAHGEAIRVLHELAHGEAIRVLHELAHTGCCCMQTVLFRLRDGALNCRTENNLACTNKDIRDIPVYSDQPSYAPANVALHSVCSKVLELKHQNMIGKNARAGISLKGNAHFKLPDEQCEPSILASILRTNLSTKIFAFCSKDILALLHPDCEASSEATSSMNNAISEVYDIMIKLNSEESTVQTLLEALINLCTVGNAIVIVRALRLIHGVLHNMLFFGTKSNQRTNEPYVEDAMEIERHKQIVHSQAGLHIENMFLPHTFLASLFTAVLHIAVKHSEEDIRADALSVMILILSQSDPDKEHEKFISVSVMECLHQLLQKGNGLLVKKHAVHILFLLLKCQGMLKLLCSGGKDGSVQTEVFGCENDKLQQSISAVLEDLPECLRCDTTNYLGLKLSRQVINVLSYIASSGESGFGVLLGSVGLCGVNFLQLIGEVLASHIEREFDCSIEKWNLVEERYFLMRELLILLNQLGSHADYSKQTLEVLAGSKLCPTLTTIVTYRSQKRKHPLSYLSEIYPEMANNLTELIQDLTLRVCTFFVLSGIHEFPA